MSPRLRLTGLVRHPNEPRVLLLRSDRTWRPPRALVDLSTWVADCRALLPAYERRLGLRPWLLRHVSVDHDEDRDVLETAQELELDGAWEIPAHGRWVARDELDRLRLRDDERALVSTYLDRLGDVPPERPPWSRPGWRGELRGWLEAELARLGRRLVGLEQVKVWSISTVLRVETDRGDLYFKVSAPLPLFVDEAAVTDRLAARFPGYVPAPVAVDRERAWMLFEPFDVVGWDTPLETRCELLRRFAGLQVRAAARVDELLADGCLDRRPAVLERQLDELLDDRAALHRLTTAEVRSLRRLRPALHDGIGRLDALGLPATLVHGDLHPGNTTWLDGTLAYFDWTDACVAHPFVDLHTLQWQPDEAVRAAQLDAYLEPWREVAAEVKLREAVALARVVTPLHHAVSYSTITRSTEPAARPELDATHSFLREALARIREL